MPQFPHQAVGGCRCPLQGTAGGWTEIRWPKHEVGEVLLSHFAVSVTSLRQSSHCRSWLSSRGQHRVSWVTSTPSSSPLKPLRSLRPPAQLPTRFLFHTVDKR